MYMTHYDYMTHHIYMTHCIIFRLTLQNTVNLLDFNSIQEIGGDHLVALVLSINIVQNKNKFNACSFL